MTIQSPQISIMTAITAGRSYWASYLTGRANGGQIRKQCARTSQYVRITTEKSASVYKSSPLGRKTGYSEKLPVGAHVTGMPTSRPSGKSPTGNQ
jgi:hypothetical protein